MSYQFAGFFTRPTVHLRELPADAVGVQIHAPFVGTAVRIRSLFGKTPAADEIAVLAHKIGVATAPVWIYLNYDCWGGRVDFVYGFTSIHGALSAPIEDSSVETVEASYLGLMSQFEIKEADALAFAPFARGFWRES